MPETENLPEAAPAAAPGQVIAPGSVAAPAEQPDSSQPQPPSTPESAPPPEPQPDFTPEPQDQQPDAGDAISWTASEFAGHQKSAGWYSLLALAAVILAGLIYLLTKDLISAAVVVVGAVIFGAYGAHQPNDVQYQMDGGGLMIGSKYHAFDEFRSFATVQEGSHSSIILSPLKRFSPLITIYYNEPDEEAIVNLLADRLPMEEHRHDAIDRLMNRIRF